MDKLHKTQPRARPLVAFYSNDRSRRREYNATMGRPARIHTDKTPHRLHYIAEHAERLGLKQADIVAQMSVDKASVSRWFSGRLPSERHLEVLAELLHTDVPGLFRHPDDDWLARFFKSKNQDEIQRAQRILRDAFPDKVA